MSDMPTITWEHVAVEGDLVIASADTGAEVARFPVQPGDSVEIPADTLKVGATYTCHFESRTEPGVWSPRASFTVAERP